MDPVEKSDVPHPRIKHLLRISLRMAFVVTTILCIWLGFKVNQVKQQREAIAWIDEHGGSVTYDFEVEFWTAYNRDPTIPFAPRMPGPKWLRDWIGEDYFIRPLGAVLRDDNLKDLSPLVKLPCLQVLDITSNGSVDVSPLADLTDLDALALTCPEVKGLSALTELKKLDDLSLRTCMSREEIAKLRELLPNCVIYHQTMPSPPARSWWDWIPPNAGFASLGGSIAAVILVLIVT